VRQQLARQQALRDQAARCAFRSKPSSGRANRKPGPPGGSRRENQAQAREAEAAAQHAEAEPAGCVSYWTPV
jgi:hypothetical protein